ncbi:MAG: ferritin family protein [Deltaproteobacteria bacterium]|nr:ferritin family protein [Deltaproteobacteria bacterium]
MDTRSCLKMLDEAIRFEGDGLRYFQDAAKRTQNEYGKLMFEAIAKAELKHMEVVRGIYDKLTASGQWPDQCPTFQSPGHLKNIFEKARAELNDKVTVNADDVEAVRIAREYEEKGIRFYTELSGKAENTIEKQFYERLTQEERGHLLILQDMDDFYADPVHWFSKKEHLHWDGA